MKLFGNQPSSMDAFIVFASSKSWPDAIAVLAGNPVLLSTEVDAVLSGSRTWANDLAGGADEHLTVTRLFAELSVLAAYPNFKNVTPIITATSPPSLRSMLALVAEAAASGRRFENNEQLGLLEQCVRAWRLVVESNPSLRLPQLASAELLRCAAYRSNELYAYSGRQLDLIFAVNTYRGCARELTACGMPNVQQTAGVYASLGNALRSLHAEGDAGALAEAIEVYETSLRIAPETPDDRAVAGVILALATRRQGPDVERAARVFAAYSNVLFGASLVIVAATLSDAFLSRYRERGAESDVNQAVQIASAASENDDVPQNIEVLRKYCLANALATRSGALGFHDDLRRATVLLEQSSASVEGLAFEAEYSTLLVNCLAILYQRTHDARYLQRARSIGDGLVASGRTTEELMCALAGVILTEAPGDLAAIDSGISLLEQAVKLASRPSTDTLMGLASAYLSRYLVARDVESVDAACAFARNAVDETQRAFLESSAARWIDEERDLWSAASVAVLCLLEGADARPAGRPRLCREAMIATEAGRGRLVNRFGGNSAISVPRGIPPLLIAREQHSSLAVAQQDRVELLNWGRLPVAADSGAGETPARLELMAVWDRIAECSPPAAAWVQARRGDLPTWADIEAIAAPGTAVISFAEPAGELVTFVLNSGAITPDVVRSGVSTVDLARCVDRLRRDTLPGATSRSEAWDAPLAEHFRDVWPHLRGANRVVLAPVATTSLLPWAAVAYKAGWRAVDDGPIAITTAPTLRWFGLIHARPALESGGALVVGNPRGDLTHAGAEAQGVAGVLRAECLLGPQATVSTVAERLPSARFIHLATHASFDPDSPLDSTITLADGALTCRDILATPLRADLVVLSACETGYIGNYGGNESAGHAQAFLYAGARSVVVSLWRVEDDVTHLFMLEFYRAVARHGDLALALATASDHVRSVARWSHTRYWAGFVLMGADRLPSRRSGAA